MMMEFPIPFQDACTYVSARPDVYQAPNGKTLPAGRFFIIIDYDAHYSADVTATCTKESSTATTSVVPQQFYDVPSDSFTHDDVSRMISSMNAPFSLENLHWNETYNVGRREIGREDKLWTRLENREDLVSRVLVFARYILKPDHNKGCKANSMRLHVSKKGSLSLHEFEALFRAKRERCRERAINRALISLIEYYGLFGSPLSRLEWRWKIDDTLKDLNNISLDRSSLEILADRALSEIANRSGAKLSSIEGLKVMRIRQDHLDSMEPCPICWGEAVVDSIFKAMPCRHMFHKECIEQWLKKSRTCPLCPFELPAKDYRVPKV